MRKLLYKKNLYKVGIIILFLINVILLTYKLDKIPGGINIDELGAYYDAISLSKYGVDRWLYHNPVYFINYGSGQNALYTYLAVISFKIFGDSIFSFRIVAVILNIISYIFYVKLIKKYMGKFSSFISLFLITIFPIFIMKGRFGLESYLFCPMLIISLYYFFVAIENNNYYRCVISGIFFGITLYTYAISYLVIPLFLFSSYIYLLVLKKINLKKIIVMMIPLIILALPLIVMLMLNMGILKNEIITNYISIPKMWMYRGNELSISNFKYFFKSLISVLYNDYLVYNSIKEFGCMYVVSIIFILIGFIISCYKVIKERNNDFNCIMMILFISILFVCGLISNLNINKANAIYICFVYLIVVFFKWLYERKKYIYLTSSVIIYIILFISFINYYFNRYEIDYKYKINFLNNDYFKALGIAEKKFKSGSYSKIYICSNYVSNNASIYMSVLYHKNISPYDFNKKVIVSKNEGFVYSYDYYYFGVEALYDKSYVYVLNSEYFMNQELVNRGYDRIECGNYYVYY